MQVFWFMRRLWKDYYSDMTALGILLFLPSIIVLYSLLSVVAIVEIVLFDIFWLIVYSIEESITRKQSISYTIKGNLWYLRH